MFLLYLQKEKTLERPLRVLDLAPKDCLRDYIKRFNHVGYVSSDLNSPHSMVWSDLTQMAMDSKVFDLIICPHILEHIPDDYAAFSELGRILKPDGFGLLMVPIRGKTTFEVPSAHSEDYEHLYGQRDHVRWYGMDIVERISAAGLWVEVLDMFELFGREVCQRNALYGDDRYVFRFSK
jgi:SAM-dependent methyltransferase